MLAPAMSKLEGPEGDWSISSAGDRLSLTDKIGVEGCVRASRHSDHCQHRQHPRTNRIGAS